MRMKMLVDLETSRDLTSDESSKMAEEIGKAVTSRIVLHNLYSSVRDGGFTVVGDVELIQG